MTWSAEQWVLVLGAVGLFIGATVGAYRVFYSLVLGAAAQQIQSLTVRLDRAEAALGRWQSKWDEVQNEKADLIVSRVRMEASYEKLLVVTGSLKERISHLEEVNELLMDKLACLGKKKVTESKTREIKLIEVK